jgi:hypothetical protein
LISILYIDPCRPFLEEKYSGSPIENPERSGDPTRGWRVGCEGKKFPWEKGLQFKDSQRSFDD